MSLQKATATIENPQPLTEVNKTTIKDTLGVLSDVRAGNNVSIDKTDPRNPIINSSSSDGLTEVSTLADLRAVDTSSFLDGQQYRVKAHNSDGLEKGYGGKIFTWRTEPLFTIIGVTDVELTGTVGEGTLTIDGLDYNLTFDVDLKTTIDNFITTNKTALNTVNVNVQRFAPDSFYFYNNNPSLPVVVSFSNISGDLAVNISNDVLPSNAINSARIIIPVTPLTKSLDADLNFGDNVIFENGETFYMQSNTSITGELPKDDSIKGYEIGERVVRLNGDDTATINVGDKCYFADDDIAYIRPIFAGYEGEGYWEADLKGYITPEDAGCIPSDSIDVIGFNNSVALQNAFDHKYNLIADADKSYYITQTIIKRRAKETIGLGYENAYQTRGIDSRRYLPLKSVYSSIYTNQNIDLIENRATGVFKWVLHTNLVPNHDKAAFLQNINYRTSTMEAYVTVIGNKENFESQTWLEANPTGGTRAFFIDGQQPVDENDPFASRSGLFGNNIIKVRTLYCHSAVEDNLILENQGGNKFTNTTYFDVRSDYTRKFIWLNEGLSLSKFEGYLQTRNYINNSTEEFNVPVKLTANGIYYNCYIWDFRSRLNSYDDAIWLNSRTDTLNPTFVTFGNKVQESLGQTVATGKQYINPLSNLISPSGYFPTSSSPLASGQNDDLAFNTALQNCMHNFKKRIELPQNQANWGTLTANAYRVPADYDFLANSSETVVGGTVVDANSEVVITNLDNICTHLKAPTTIDYTAVTDKPNTFVEIVFKAPLGNDGFANRILSINELYMLLTDSFIKIQVIQGTVNTLENGYYFTKGKFKTNGNGDLIVRFIGKDDTIQNDVTSILDLGGFARNSLASTNSDRYMPVITSEGNQSIYGDIEADIFKEKNNAIEYDSISGTLDLPVDTLKSFYIKLNGNLDLSATFDPDTNQSVIVSGTIISVNLTETLTLVGAWNIIGEYDPTKVNEVVIEVVKFPVAGVVKKITFGQVN